MWGNWRNRGGLLAVLLVVAGAGPGYAQETEAENPLGLNLIQSVEDAAAPEQISTTLIIFFLLTVLSLAPAILVMTTSFTRIIVVLGFLRQAMATQQSPPNQVLIGLALLLTFFVMFPTYQAVNETAIQPYIEGEFDNATDAFEAGLQPLREFMFEQTRPKDIALFLNIAGLERPETRDDVPTTVLVNGFIISELRKAFQIGFLIYVPFLIIDMVVASTLMAMGMMMLPPVFVSLPFKIIMFVLADGWYLLIGSLVRSFQ